MSTQQLPPASNANGENPPQVGDAPATVASKVASAVAPVAGIASTEEPAGAPAVKTGTAIPAAALANKESRNAGVHQGALSNVRTRFSF